MEIEYSNQVTGFDFNTRTANFQIKGKCRKSTETGGIVEFSAEVTKLSEPYPVPPREVRFQNGQFFYHLSGLTAPEIEEVIGGVQDLSEEFTA